MRLAIFCFSFWASAVSAQVVPVSDADATMNAAIAAARATVPAFLDVQLPSGGRTGDAVMIKVAVPVKTADGPSLEHIWVGYVAERGNGLTGLLQNQPRFFEGAVGGEISFVAEDVSDWMIDCPDARYGGWTVRAVYDIQGTALPDGFSADPLLQGYACGG